MTTVYSNRLETLPREILFDIIERLSSRDVIRVIDLLNPLSSLDSDAVDYICLRAHKRDFKPTLSEITMIEHKIKVGLTFNPTIAAGYPSGISTRRYQGEKVTYHSFRLGLSSVSGKPWPKKLQSSPHPGYAPSLPVYIKRYVREIIPGKRGFKSGRDIIVRKDHIGDGILEFNIRDIIV